MKTDDSGLIEKLEQAAKECRDRLFNLYRDGACTNNDEWDKCLINAGVAVRAKWSDPFKAESVVSSVKWEQPEFLPPGHVGVRAETLMGAAAVTALAEERLNLAKAECLRLRARIKELEDGR